MPTVSLNFFVTSATSTFGSVILQATPGPKAVLPLALSYLLHEDPEVLFWDYRESTLIYTPNLREESTTCSLHYLRQHIAARWCIGCSDKTFGLLSPGGDSIRGLVNQLFNRRA